MAVWTETYYKCLRCGETDVDLTMADRTPSPVANCWNCGSGRESPDHRHNLAHNEGMRIVTKAEALKDTQEAIN